MDRIIRAGIGILNLLYRIFWIVPVQNKVTFLSRQSNEPSIDIRLLADRIRQTDPTCRVCVMCRMIPEGRVAKIGYAFHMLRQMYHIATSKVVVLDTYCIAVCVLRHRPQLTVIQMWHAMGCLKKFGYSILDQAEGRSSRVAEQMRMHRNYDYVLVSSERCKAPLAEAYRCREDHMKVMPLPRMDLLKDPVLSEKTRTRIRGYYPELEGKKVILYAPTFRKNESQETAIEHLIRAVDAETYAFVLKYHPILQTSRKFCDIIQDNEFTSLEWMCVADYVVTDYSAVVFEAAAAGLPLFFYAYDLEHYIGRRSFYIDYRKEMPGVISEDPKRISEAIRTDTYDKDKIREFSNKYVVNQTGNTKRLAEFILSFTR